MKNLTQHPQALASQNQISTSINCKNNYSFNNNNGTVNINIFGQESQESNRRPNILLREYYNLFVVPDLHSGQTFFTIDKKYCLNNYGNTNIENKYRNLSADVISEIKTMPSLLLKVEEPNGKRGESQCAAFGNVCDLCTTDKSISINFNILERVQYSPLLKLFNELNIVYTEFISEFNKCHWSIKKVDLIGVLTKNTLLNNEYDEYYPKIDELENGK